MNKVKYLLLVLLLSTTRIYAQTPDSWAQVANFPGVARVDAISFSIGGMGYVGLGMKDTTPYYQGFVADLWQYDPSANQWNRKATFPGIGRQFAICFVIGSKAYMGLGVSINDLKDFWEYNAVTDVWTQKANFGGGYREQAVGFSIGSWGYVGLGYDDSSGLNKQDFWKYDPGTDTWSQLADFAGGARVAAVGFSIYSTGYVGFGWASNNNRYCKRDLWAYDTASDSWAAMADFPSLGRLGSFVFCIGDKSYIGTGIDSTTRQYKEVWEYNTTTNAWIEKDSFGGAMRSDAASFSIGNIGYAGTGDTTVNHGYVKDFWMYTPDSISTGIRSIDESSISIYPDPASDRLIINNLAPHTPIIITDMLGQVMIRDIAETSKISIDVSSLPPGVYCVNNRKFVKE